MFGRPTESARRPSRSLTMADGSSATREAAPRGRQLRNLENGYLGTLDHGPGNLNPGFKRVPRGPPRFSPGCPPGFPPENLPRGPRRTSQGGPRGGTLGKNMFGRPTLFRLCLLNSALGFPRHTLRSCCTERSTHTCARVPADLAQARDGGGRLREVLGRVCMGFYIWKPNQNIAIIAVAPPIFLGFKIISI